MGDLKRYTVWGFSRSAVRLPGIERVISTNDGLRGDVELTGKQSRNIRPADHVVRWIDCLGAQ